MGIPKEKTYEIMNLPSLANHILEHDVNWKEINYNYYCDYHFSCNEFMRNSLFISLIYDTVVKKFEYEGSVYENYNIPYQPMSIKENIDLFNELIGFIQPLQIYPEIEYKRNLIKKYFLSISDRHAEEVLESIPQIMNDVDDHCIDSPILYITHFVKDNLTELKKGNIKVTNFVELIKYQESDVIGKNELIIDRFALHKTFFNLIKGKIHSASHVIKDNKLKVFFENMDDELLFENLIKTLTECFPEEDVRIQDFLDIIDFAEVNGFQKIYTFDSADINAAIRCWK